MTFHTMFVGLVLLTLGGLSIASNVSESIRRLEEQQQSDKASPQSAAPNSSETNPTESDRGESDVSISTQDGTSRDREQVNRAESSKAESTEATEASVNEQPAAVGAKPGEAEWKVNQIPRVQVAAIVMPLGVGLSLLGCGLFAWLVKSDQPIWLAVILGAVAGLLMMVLAIEYSDRITLSATDLAGRSAAVLALCGAVSLSLPVRAYWSGIFRGESGEQSAQGI